MISAPLAIRIVSAVMFVAVSTAVLPAVSVARDGVADQSADDGTTDDSRAVAAAGKSADYATTHRARDSGARV